MTESLPSIFIALGVAHLHLSTRGRRRRLVERGLHRLGLSRRLSARAAYRIP